MATVFLGTSQFAAAVLERLVAAGHPPALVITRPDRPAGRGRRLRPPPVGERARELGLALEQPANVNDAGSLQLIAAALEQTEGAAGEGAAGGDRASAGDTAPGSRPVVVVCAFGALIKEPLLSSHEILNVHPSLLPRWRGAAPIERAIMAGDERTGVSIMRLTAGLDSGPVCLAGEEPIGPRDDYGSLAERLQELGGRLLVCALEQEPACSEQPEEGVTYAEKITADDRLLDPARAAVELERTVRALHPHIGARVQLEDGALLGVRRAAVVGGARAPDPGSAAGARPARGVFVGEGRLLLACSPGLLELLEVQPPGGRAMEAGAYLRGHAAPGRR
ncbi:MAG TPA: methionyl-tRNA formyltransferase [Solirubrobacteraceae bacterium]|nr:methionyl-tRNA formyltransferase [Solirubrobacteraceae bacterium]